MKLLFICPRWGSDRLEPAAFIGKVVAAGYDGVEMGITDPDPLVDETIRCAREAGLSVILQHYDTMERNLAQHVTDFRSRLMHLASFQPMFINSHTGRDLYSMEENLRVFDVADEVARETGIRIVHETHRGRCFHSAWRTAALLKERSNVRLTLDMSHWCCVSESLLADQADLLAGIIPHVDHVHARVGWSHGPQVSDPRAPEWNDAVQAHLVWWDRIVDLKRSAGLPLTITPEFGPEPYLPVEPNTRKPLANQWDINIHMMHLLRTRYTASGAVG